MQSSEPLKGLELFKSRMNYPAASGRSINPIEIKIRRKRPGN